MADMQLGQPHPHLPLLREDRTAERKKRPGFPGPRPDRGGRDSFAPQLEEAATRIISQKQRMPAPQYGIHPHLVFKIPFAEGANVDQLIDSLEKQAGIEIVSVEPDRAVVAFRDDLDLREYQAAINRYREGPKKGINLKTGKPYKSTAADFLEYIEPEKITLWNRLDRIGARLREVIGVDGSSVEPSSLYIVDLELWHPGGADAAKRALEEVRLLVETSQVNKEQVLDTFVGQFMILAKVSVTGTRLLALLDLDVVSEAELPPRAVFKPLVAGRATPRDFPSPPPPAEDGPRLCIIDSGIVSSHPLLANNVGHEEAVMTQEASPSDANGHGTMVGGLAVFGDVRECYESGQFASPIMLFSARVLNDKNEFDDSRLIINQMREAIEIFKRHPNNCRVYNVSLGSELPVINSTRSRQTLWAEELDILAREQKVLLVVSAGNHGECEGRNPADAEAALASYPSPLFRPLTGLCDPATSAIAITVGSLAQYDAPALASGSAAGDIVKPLARANEPSPFTRVGPGINGAIKPEVVHYGGNYVFRGFGSSFRRIDDEPGTAVMSLSHQPTQQLFAYDCGTSFSTARVSRLAALLEHGLERELGERPSPNLIRAVLASSASIPESSIILLQSYENGHGPCIACGYGLPLESDALTSHDRRVTMVYQGTIRIDSFNIFAVPIPDEFRNAHGERKIIVSLAYDPPVRRRRLDYLGVEMDVVLIRGKTLDDVFNAFRSAGPDEDPILIGGSFRVDLEPKANPRSANYSRKKSTLQRCEKVMKRPERADVDYGNEYYLVVRSERKWAPEDIESQDFGLAVTLCASNEQLYNQVALRVRQRVQARARTS